MVKIKRGVKTTGRKWDEIVDGTRQLYRDIWAGVDGIPERKEDGTDTGQ